jgi:hypothetical protein
VRRLALSYSSREVTRPFTRALCRRLAVLCQRLFEFLFDAEGIGRGARPEFPQGMQIALAPSDKSLRVFPTFADEGDNAVGELAERHRVEGRGVEPVDDERTVAADPFEAFARRPFRGGLGRIKNERRLLDFFSDEGVAEVLGPALTDGLRFCAFGEHEDTAPKYLIRDNDRAFGGAFKARVRAMGIRDRPTSFRSPWQNGYAERLIGSVRCEALII